MGDEHWDATETASRIRAREVSTVEVVEAAVRRAEKATALGALVTTSFERAVAEAERIDAAGPDSGKALHGVPTAIKDLEDVAGLPAAMGSRAFAGRVPTATAGSVAQFLATGAVSLGKSSTPEWGMTATTEPLEQPPTRNPWDRERTVGGSSGGAAALVAAGIVPIAYATDGGGSIRIPASACGLVGLKPSRGRLAPLSRSENLPIKVTTYGAVATSVRDVATFHAAVEAVEPAVGLPRIGRVTEPSARRLRIGVVRDTPTGRVIDPEVLAGVDATAGVLDDLGHVTVAMDNPFGQELVDDFTLFWGFLAWGIRRVVGPQMVGRSFEPALLDPWTLALGEHFRRNAWRFPAALRRLRAVERTYAEAYAPYDVVLHPTNGTRPPVLGHLSVELPFEEHRERVERWVPFTPVQNLSGSTAISLPLWRTTDGLPIGMHLSTVTGDERTLLELSLELEQAMPWPRTAPTA